MGGNALKEFNPKRVTSMDVMNIWWRIEAITNLFGVEAHLVPWCLDKETHGDVDILIHQDIEVHFVNLLGWLNVDSKHIVRNGPVISFGYPINGHIVQVDFIKVSSVDMQFARCYYSGGGLGMILGRVASWYGYVFAADGLRLRADRMKPWSRDITITSDPKAALQFLGYKPADACGFRKEEDVWRFGLSSGMAQPFMFMPELAGADNRSRDRARPSYQRFQDWLRKTYPDRIRIRDSDVPHCYDDAIKKAEWLRNDIYDVANEQCREWNASKEMNYTLGMGAVLYWYPSLTPEQAGPIIRDMQLVLPDKENRKKLYNDPQKKQLLIKVVQAAALSIGQDHGYTPINPANTNV
jgi:hypothetical protein